MSETRESRQVRTFAFHSVAVLTGVLAHRTVHPFLVEIGWAVVLAICLAPAARPKRRIGLSFFVA